MARGRITPRGMKARVSWTIVIVLVVVVVISIVVSVILLSGPEPELLASDSGIADADSWSGHPITVPRERFTNGIPLVEIALLLDDSRAEITWHFYICDMPNCVISIQDVAASTSPQGRSLEKVSSMWTQTA